MKIKIKHADKYQPEFFIYLLKYIKQEIYKTIDLKQLARFEEYFNLEKKYLNKLKNHISVLEVLYCACENLKIYDFSTELTIEINRSILLPKTKLRVVDLCKAINYGTSLIIAYPIFTKVFKKIEKDLPKIYEDYIKNK